MVQSVLEKKNSEYLGASTFPQQFECAHIFCQALWEYYYSLISDFFSFFPSRQNKSNKVNDRILCVFLNMYFLAITELLARIFVFLFFMHVCIYVYRQ